MTIEQVIKKGVGAGYKGTDGKLDLHLDEKYSEFGIAKDDKRLKHIYVRYVAKGYDTSRLSNTYNETYDYHELAPIFVDPTFWQSLGKAFDWQPATDYEIPWKIEWHRFIDHVADGKRSEEFFKELS